MMKIGTSRGAWSTGWWGHRKARTQPWLKGLDRNNDRPNIWAQWGTWPNYYRLTLAVLIHWAAFCLDKSSPNKTKSAGIGVQLRPREVRARHRNDKQRRGWKSNCNLCVIPNVIINALFFRVGRLPHRQNRNHINKYNKLVSMLPASSLGFWFQLVSCSFVYSCPVFTSLVWFCLSLFYRLCNWITHLGLNHQRSTHHLCVGIACSHVN